jgi:transcriptional regulator with XRE-family HTH domain
MLREARRAAGLSQTDLARRAHTSRPTLSAYEHGRTVPTLQTAERILAAAGYDLVAVPRIVFRDVVGRRGRVFSVPNRLPRLAPHRALATVTLPSHIMWSGEAKVDLADHRQRARAYETVLREGRGEDIAALVDGTLLLELWEELVLPPDIRAAWQPVVNQARSAA